MLHAGSRFIVKAGGGDDHHIERELYAHLHWLLPWTSRGRAPTLEHGDAEAKLLVTTFLPGRLVLGSDRGDDPSTYRQAGELLAAFHAQAGVTDHHDETRENEKALGVAQRITPHHCDGPLCQTPVRHEDEVNLCGQ